MRTLPPTGLAQLLEPRLLLTTVDLGVLTTTPQNRSDSVSPGDVDQFHFDLNADSTFTATISGITGGARVNVALIQDLNGNGIVDSGETLETGDNSFSGTSINLSEPLSAGTSYFVQVTSGLSTTGSYSIALSGAPIMNAVDAGNSLAAARNAGSLGISATTFVDSIQTPDVDVYRFTLDSGTANSASTLAVSFTGLSERVDVSLIRDLNGNNVADSGESLESANNNFSGSNISLTEPLADGTYFLIVTPTFSDTNTSYSLNLSATPIENALDAGNTLATARNAGTLGVSATTFVDVAQQSGQDVDVYRFTLDSGTVNSASTLAVSITGLSERVDVSLIRDLNGNNIADSGEALESANNNFSGSNISLTEPLADGTYFLIVTPTFSDTNTSYSLNLSAMPIENAVDAGNTLATASSIGLVTTDVVSFVDVVQQAGQDDDFRRFSLSEASDLTVTLQGVSETATLQIIRDVNGNNVVDSGDVLRSDNVSGATFSYTQLLAAGDYFVRVAPPSSATNTAYTLSLNSQIAPPPEVQVVENSVILVSGSTAVDFGAATVGHPTVSKTFTVTNVSNGESVILQPATFASGSGFTITQNVSANQTLTSGQSATIVVRLDTVSVGSKSALLSIPNNDSDESPFLINLSGVIAPNQAPVVGGFGGSVGYTENAAAVMLDADATVSDADSADFNAGTLTVSLTGNGEAGDRLEVRHEGTGAGQIAVSGNTVRFSGSTIGTLSGGSGLTPLTITLNASATPAAVQALLRNITFRSVSENPTENSRTVSVLVADGDGGTSSVVTKTVAVTAVNDAPSVTGLTASVAYVQRDPAVQFGSAAVVMDPDSVDFSSGSLTVAVTTNGEATDRIEITNQGTGAGQIGISGTNVSFGGVVIGTFAGGSGTTPLTVTLNSNSSVAAVQALLRSVSYRSTSNTPAVGTRNVALTLTDGDGGSTSQSLTLNIILRPTVTIALSDSALRLGETSQVTFSFNVAPVGFTASDVTVENATLSGFGVTADPRVYQATLTPTVDLEDGSNVVNVGTGYTSSGGIVGAPGTSGNYSIDTLAPTVAISLERSNLNLTDDSVTVQFVFSESVTGFAVADLVATGGTLSGFTMTDASHYSATFTALPGIEQTGSIGVATSYTDLAGNPGGSGSENIAIDTLAPSVVVNLEETLLTASANTSPVTFEFSEDITGFAESDVSVSGGTLSDFTGSGRSYSALFTATINPDVEVTASVSVGTDFQDTAGNAGVSASDSVLVDTLGPSVDVNIVEPQLNTTQRVSTVLIDFSEPVTGFAFDDLSATGGTIDEFTQDNPTRYVVRFTADADAETTGSVSVGTGFTDVGGNPADNGGSDSVPIDTRVPTVVLNLVESTLTSSSTTSLVTIDFSEPVTGFELGDLSATGGTLDNFTTLDASRFTAVFTASDGVEGTGAVSLGSGYVDLGGNAGPTASDSLNIDTVSPTVNVDFDRDRLNGTQSISVVTFEFSEDVSGFDGADVEVSGGSLENFTMLTARSYSADFIADIVTDAETTASVSVGTGYTDSAGNIGVGGSNSIIVDTLAPTVAVNVLAGSLNRSSAPTVVTFDFSEDVTAFSIEDISATGGTLSNFRMIDARHYDVEFTASLDVELNATISVGGGYFDLAGNVGTMGTDSVEIDTLAPTVSINIVASQLNIGSNSTTIEIEFSEAVLDFDESDLIVSSGTLANFTALSTTRYSVVLTAAADVELRANCEIGTGYRDAANNVGIAGSSSIVIDTVAPTVAVEFDSGSLNASSNTSFVRFLFSEEVPDFGLGHVSVFGGGLTNFEIIRPGIEFRALFTATIDVEISASVTVNADFRDATDNGGLSTVEQIVVDTAAPTLTVTFDTDQLSRNQRTTNVTFDFSEPVSGFDLDDLTIVGGILTGLTEVTTARYTALFTATLDLDVTASISVGVDYWDAANNGGAAAALGNVSVDTTAPTVVVTFNADSLTETNNTTLVTFEFSEDVNRDVGGFSFDFVTVTGGSLSNFVAISGSRYTADFTATIVANIEVIASITVGGGYADLFGNGGAEASEVILVDTLRPTAVVTLDESLLNLETNSTVATFDFSEDVNGFDLDDVTVTGGVLSEFTVISARSYSAIFTAAAGIDISVSILVGAGYFDTAGNGGLEASGSVTIDTLAPTVVVTLDAESLNRSNRSSVVRFEFSEVVTGFHPGLLTVTGGSVENLRSVSGTDSGTVFEADFTASLDIESSVSIVVGAGYFDARGNGGTSASGAVAVDTLAPAATFSVDVSVLIAVENSTVVFIDFDEPVTDFTAADLSTTVGELSDFTVISTTRFSVRLTVGTGIEVTASIIVGTDFRDGVGNFGASHSVNVAVDTLAPTLTITPDAATTEDSPIVFEFVFSEAVAEFEVSDISIQNGIAGTLRTLSTNRYLLAVTPIVSGTVSVSVSIGLFVDLAGNNGGAATVSMASQLSPPRHELVRLPDDGGTYELLIEDDSIVIRISGGADLLRRTASLVTGLTIQGSSSSDRVFVQAPSGIITRPVTTVLLFDGNNGDDVFEGTLWAGAMTLSGGAGADTLSGGLGPDEISGGDGNDSLKGNTGSDSLFGEAGDDQLQGGAQADLLIGGDGNDGVFGQGSTGDSVGGGAGDDTLDGGSGNDLLLDGGDANITLTPDMMTGLGNDVLISVERAHLTGGDSDNRIDVSGFFVPGFTTTTVLGGAGDDTIIGSQANEVFRGDQGDDSLIGNDGNDYLAGGANSDTLDGGGGNDRLRGQGGSGDRLTGGSGKNDLNGGAGNDVMVETVSGNVKIDRDNRFETDVRSTFREVQTLVINGDDAGNRIDASGFSRQGILIRVFGGDGDDTLIGSRFNDMLDGGDGNDILNGGAGNDTLLGGDGNDGLSGYTGDDSLRGGLGRDTLVGHDGSDSLFGEVGFDTLIGGGGTSTEDDGPDQLTGGSEPDFFDGLPSEFQDFTGADRNGVFEELLNWVDLV